MNRVIVVGSPRVDGRSAFLADQLLYACIEECPDDVVSIVSVASTQVGPCTGCDACARETEPAGGDPMEEGDPLAPHPAVAASDAALHRCVIDDDMPEVRKHLDAADELIVVSPVYFAGAPAQFKCLLDRLQPYYRSDLRARVKRPMILHVVGEGGDPHGYDPLVGTVMSAFSVAGFRLESIFDWVGKISEDGEFLGDPEEYALADAAGVESEGAEAEQVEQESTPPSADEQGKRGTDPCPAKPKLSLSQPAKGAKRSASGQGERALDDGRRASKDGGRSSKRGGRSSSGNRRDGGSSSRKNASQHGKGGSGAQGGKGGSDSRGGSSRYGGAGSDTRKAGPGARAGQHPRGGIGSGRNSSGRDGSGRDKGGHEGSGRGRGRGGARRG